MIDKSRIFWTVYIVIIVLLCVFGIIAGHQDKAKIAICLFGSAAMVLVIGGFIGLETTD